MKENSIEEDIKLLEEFSNENVLYGFTVGMTLKKYKDLQFSTEHILSDYKRVLKENEELRQQKIDNQKINLLAQNDMLNYQNGYEDGKANRRSAVQSIIDNQQYYIFQKQIEKYEREIEKLQKENEELKNRCRNLDKEAQGYFEGLAGDDTLSTRTIKQLQEENKTLKDKYAAFTKMSCEVIDNSIPVQKVKDKIEELNKNILNAEKFDEIILKYRYQKQALQELLEGRK